MKTNDRKITDLMATIHTGKTQLPDFQRGWVWDDGRIKALIASITNGYPVGAAMFLEYGNESIHFKSRVVEGAPSADKVIPDELILDGQQRLTSVYSSLFSEKAVRTRTDKGQEIERFYYIDMAKAVNSTIDRVDSIISVPKDRKITSDFGRKVELDLSSASQEYAQNVFPLNIILDPSKYSKWQMDYMQYHQYDSNAAKLYMFHYFREESIRNIAKQYGWDLITPQNMADKFMKFIETMDMSYSYKPVLLKAIYEYMDSSGRVALPDVVDYFIDFYEDRKAHGMIAEKSTSIYQKGGYTRKDVEKNILSNPFKRFEDMRFLMRCKDVETIEVNPIIFRKLTREDWLHIVNVCNKSLEKYYLRLKK